MRRPATREGRGLIPRPQGGVGGAPPAKGADSFRARSVGGLGGASRTPHVHQRATAARRSSSDTGRAPDALFSRILTTLPLKKPPLAMTSESVSMLPVTLPVAVISTSPVATRLPS